MKLEEMLRDKGITYEKHAHRAAYTSQALAAEEHVSGYDVAKPVIVKSGVGFTMCVLPACAHLDLIRVGKVLDDEVRLATEKEMADLFPECELGAEPPVGPLFGMATIADEALLEDEFLTMQAGLHTEALRVRCQDWRDICHPTVARIAQP
ncbi:MAG: aminoacyl-tRNA deacylase [Phycisphaerae bacterium]